MKAMPRAIKDFVRRSPVSRVATVLEGDIPHSAPVCHVFDGEFIYIDVSHNGGTAKGVANGGKVTVLIDDYYQNWRRLRGMIIYVRAREAKGEAKKKAWRMIRRKFPQSVKAEWNPRLTLILRITAWEQWGVIP